jgi:predicted AAA+ superfamily ATPase
LPTSDWIAQARAAAHPQSLKSLYAQIWLGAYPRLQTQGAQSRDVFYRSYVQTYVQRDVRELLKVSDPLSFHRFLGVVAARTGQLLNYTQLGNEVDIDTKTAKAWLSVLEASGLVYLLQPYHRNLTKRMIKSPKLYFLDTGLAAYLTKWSSPESLEAGSMSGAILETWAVAEILKSYWHNGKEAPLYFYRDTDQKEIDLLIESDDTIYPIEIKKTATPSTQASKAFAAAGYLGKTVGRGAVLCLTPRDVPLTASVTAIPMGYL